MYIVHNFIHAYEFIAYETTTMEWPNERKRIKYHLKNINLQTKKKNKT